MYRNLDIDSLLRHAELDTQPGGERGGHQPNHQGDRRAVPHRKRSARDTNRLTAGVRAMFSLSRVRSRDGRPAPPSR